MRKHLVVMMCIIMAVCLIPAVAMAEGESNIATVNGKECADLTEVVGAVAADDTGIISIQLLHDIELGDNMFSVPEGKTVNIDLNGYVITYSGDNYALYVGSNTNTLTSLVIEDTSVGQTGTVKATRDAVAAISNNNGALIIRGGRFVNDSHYAIFSTKALTIDPADGQTVDVTGNGAVSLRGGSDYQILNDEVATISGGSFTATTYYGLCFAETTNQFYCNVTGGTFNGGTTNKSIYVGQTSPIINISGGVFEDEIYGVENAQISITGGTFSDNPGDYVDTTEYTVGQNNGTYIVGKPVAQIINGQSYLSVQAAINAAGETQSTVVMLSDTTEQVTINSGQIVTLDLKSRKLDGNITSYGSLTIQDTLGNGFVGSVSQKTGGNISIEGGTYKSCPSSLYWADGFICVKNDSGTYSACSIGDNSCYLKGTSAAAIGAFPTVTDAISNASGSSTYSVILCKDTSEEIAIPKNKKIIIDLSGNLLTGSITDSGTLTVKDSKATTTNPNKVTKVEIADTAAKLIVSKSTTCAVEAVVSALPEYYITGNGSQNSPYKLKSYSVSITSNGATYYEKTLSQAVSTAGTEKTALVTLLADFNVSTNGITIPKGAEITLDLNGHYVKADNIIGKNIQVAEGSTLTLKDSTDTEKNGTGTGMVKYNGYGSDGLIHVEGTFVMESGLISCNVMPYRTGVAVWGSGNVTICGGKIDAGAYALAGNGSETGITSILIDGGTLSSVNDVAIYHPQNGTLTISGGTITGTEGVQMCSGKLIIKGNPYIIATGADRLSAKEGDGSLPDGAAVSVVNRPGYQNLPVANISGTPSLKAAEQERAIRVYTWNSANKTADEWSDGNNYVTVTGGIYSDKSAETFVPDDREIVSNTDVATQNTHPWMVDYKSADYSGVDTAIGKIPDDLSLYTEESVAVLNQVVNAVVRNKNITEQAEVDGYVTTIENAIAALVYKPADYSKVDEAIEKANALNKNDYKDFSAVESAIEAVVRDKDITEQPEVDAMAKAIEDAIVALEKKSVTASTIPSTPTDNVTNSGTAGTDNATTNADLSNTTTTSNGTTTSTVDKTTADKIVDKAVANKSEEIVIDATANSTTDAASTTTAQVGIPTATFEAIAEKTDADVKVKTDVAEVKMDNTAAGAVAEQATGDTVQIIAEKVAEETDKVEFELKVVCSDGKVISDFKGGNVAVTVALPKAMAEKKVVCVYIDDNGHMSKMEGKKNADGTYTFNTGHFSSYAILTEEEADAAIEAQKEAIRNIKIKLRSELVETKYGKKAVKVNWTVIEGNKKLDGVEIYRSTERYKGYGNKPFYTSAKGGKSGSYINTKSLENGIRYYYKVRGYILVDGQKVYTDYSTKAWRTVR